MSRLYVFNMYLLYVYVCICMCSVYVFIMFCVSEYHVHVLTYLYSSVMWQFLSDFTDRENIQSLYIIMSWNSRFIPNLITHLWSVKSDHAFVLCSVSLLSLCDFDIINGVKIPVWKELCPLKTKKHADKNFK